MHIRLNSSQGEPLGLAPVFSGRLEVIDLCPRYRATNANKSPRTCGVTRNYSSALTNG